MQAVGYVRVSTKDQSDDGVSLDAQRAKIRAWAELHDADLLEICADEGISGKTLAGRPGAQRAIALACEHKAVLVVFSLSRLSRSTADTISISERLRVAGAELASCKEQFDTSTAAGRLFFTMMALINQFERETGQERTQSALDHKAEKGEALGNTPYGWRKDRGPIRTLPDGSKTPAPKMVVDHDEQRALGIMMAGHAAGESFGVIADRLTRMGIMNRNGKPWNRGSVRRIVREYQTDRGRKLIEKARLATPQIA